MSIMETFVRKVYNEFNMKLAALVAGKFIKTCLMALPSNLAVNLNKLLRNTTGKSVKSNRKSKRLEMKNVETLIEKWMNDFCYHCAPTHILL